MISAPGIAALSPLFADAQSSEVSRRTTMSANDHCISRMCCIDERKKKGVLSVSHIFGLRPHTLEISPEIEYCSWRNEGLNP